MAASGLILDKFLEFFPFNLEDEKIELKKKEVLGIDEKKISIFEVILKKEKHISKFLVNLIKNIDDENKRVCTVCGEVNCGWMAQSQSLKVANEN